MFKYWLLNNTFLREADGVGGGSGAGAGEGDDGSAAAGAGGATGDGAGGAPKPSDAEAKLLKEVMASKARLKEAEAQVLALKQKFDGIDPEAVKALLAAQKQAEDEALRKAGEFDKLRERMAAEHQREIEKIRGEHAQTNKTIGDLNAHIVELTIGSAFKSSQFITAETVLTPDKARKLYGDYFELNETGQIIPYDAPKGTASRTPLVNGAGVPLSLDEAMKRIIEGDTDRDALLRSKRAAGSGVNSSPNLRQQDNSQRTVPLSGLERITAALKARTQK